MRLIRSENVGPVTFHQLIQRFGTASDALAALPDLARRGGSARRLKVASLAEARAELETVAEFGAQIVACGEAAYPARLGWIEDAPPLLTLKGHGHLANRPGVAMVGARNASAIGMRFARDLARDLARQDFVVISGLARGIDRAAHDGALQAAPTGGTYGFVGAGIDVVFPPENADLYQRLFQAGAVYAELPMGAGVKAQNFPRRNRLIAGACLGVVVVEAALKSGSLITARMAAQQGREVMAVPGSPLDPRCNGSNDLIRNGAALVEGVADILAVIEPLLRNESFAAPPRDFQAAPAAPISDAEISAAHIRLMALLSPTPAAIDDLIRESGQSAAAVQAALLEKELAGLVVRHRGNKISLA